MELRPSAGHSAALRSEPDREDQEPSGGGGQTTQAQGCDRAGERLRRGARGRTDFPPHPAIRRGQEGAGQAGEAAVAAVDDAAGHPRRVRASARRCRHAPAGRCRAQSQRGRLAGGHQRHASDDRVQLEGRRLFPHPGGPGADAHAVHRGDTRRADPQAHCPRILRGARAVWRARRGVCGQVVRSGVQARGRCRRPRRPAVGQGAR